jgi:hypothetical protein
MTIDAIRQLDNYLLSTPLSGRPDGSRQPIASGELLRYLASRIVDHSHLREILMSENNRYERHEKFEAMRPYLSFRPYSLGYYEMQERILGRNMAAQPITREKEEYGRRIYPVSQPFYA